MSSRDQWEIDNILVHSGGVVRARWRSYSAPFHIARSRIPWQMWPRPGVRLRDAIIMTDVGARGIGPLTIIDPARDPWSSMSFEGKNYRGDTLTLRWDYEAICAAIHEIRAVWGHVPVVWHLAGPNIETMSDLEWADSQLRI